MHLEREEKPGHGSKLLICDSETPGLPNLPAGSKGAMDTAVVELAARSLLAAPAPFTTLAALEKLPASESPREGGRRLLD